MKKSGVRILANNELDRRAKGILRMAIWKADNIGADETLQVSVGSKALCAAYPDMPMDEALTHARELHKSLADKQKKREEYRNVLLQSKRQLDNEIDLDFDNEADLAGTKKTKANKKSRFFPCGNCGQKLFQGATRCPKCGYPWRYLRQRNEQNCAACNATIPRYYRVPYTRTNKWQDITICPECGFRIGALLGIPNWLVGTILIILLIIILSLFN